MVCAGFVLPKSSLLFPQLFVQGSLDPVQYDTAQNFAGNRQQHNPLQFLHSLRLPFLGSLTSSPVFHSDGISSVSRILFNSPYSSSVVAETSDFRMSGGMLSNPGAFPSLSYTPRDFFSVVPHCHYIFIKVVFHSNSDFSRKIVISIVTGFRILNHTFFV